MAKEKAAEADTLSGTEGLSEMTAYTPREERAIKEAELIAQDAHEGASFDCGACAMVDSLDPMQPAPRAGKFFAELIVRGEETSAAGLTLPGENPEEKKDDVRPKRARVLQLGPERGERWDFAAGWDVIVPYHAGEHFSWFSRPGIDETLWIIDTNEVLAVFKPRTA